MNQFQLMNHLNLNNNNMKKTKALKGLVKFFSECVELFEQRSDKRNADERVALIALERFNDSKLSPTMFAFYSALDKMYRIEQSLLRNDTPEARREAKDITIYLAISLILADD